MTAAAKTEKPGEPDVAPNSAPSIGAPSETQTPPPPSETASTDAVGSADFKDAVREALREELASMKAAMDAAGGAEETSAAEQRTIAHALFSYRLPGGGEAIAMRGQTVNLLPADIKRGERFGAFTQAVGEKPTPTGSTLPGYPADESEAEQDAWVVAGTEDEILAAVNGKPEIVDSVIRAEQRRKDSARSTLLLALAALAGRS